MRVGYIRVSTSEQNTERQKMVLAKYDIEKFFEEKISGKNTKRQKLEEMRNFVREGDVVYVSELARLARNLSDLLTITKEFQEKGVQLVSDKENIDTSSATGRLVFHMIASLAEFGKGLQLLKKQGKILVVLGKNLPRRILMIVIGCINSGNLLFLIWLNGWGYQGRLFIDY